MSQGADGELLALYDDAPLSGRFWATLVLVYAQAAFEFFDYFLVSYLVLRLNRKVHRVGPSPPPATASDEWLVGGPMNLLSVSEH
jgi:hypothetical protein